MSRNKSKRNVSKGTVKEDYFEYTEKLKQELGERSILLMQVGSFYEIYCKYDTLKDEYYGSNLIDIINICNGILSNKMDYYGENTKVVMWGFPDSKADKFINLIRNANYSIWVYDQEKSKDGSVIKRVHTSTITPGTYISTDEDVNQEKTNNFSCIWIKKFTDFLTKKKKIAYGYSNINSFSGRSHIFEGRIQHSVIDVTTFDELERQILSNYPNEVLLVTDLNEKEYKLLLNIFNSENICVHNYDYENKKVKNCMKNSYKSKLLNSIFGPDTDKLSEFIENEIATESLCFLIDFINRYNPLVIDKITIPFLNSSHDYVMLANHTLKQLNIIEDGINVTRKRKMSSVLSFLNNCASKIGRRGFQDILLNPSKDEDYLNKEYDMIEYFDENYKYVELIREKLRTISDIELIMRKMVVKKAMPSDLSKLYRSFTILNTVLVEFKGDNKIENYLLDGIDNLNLFDDITSILSEIDDKVQINKCDSDYFDFELINEKYNKEYSDILRKYYESEQLFEGIRENINNYMNKTFSKGKPVDYIKIHTKEKTGDVLQITKTRSKLLSEYEKRAGKPLGDIKIKIYEKEYTIKLKEIEFINATGTNNELSFKLLNDTIYNKGNLKLKLSSMVRSLFYTILEELIEKFSLKIDYFSQIVSKIDVIHCKTYNKRKYNYSKPIINNDTDKSFVNVTELRHPIIEQLQNDELYVTNDIELGKEYYGMLLFGTNAVGKTSFIRALGISIILAQSGMYVPAKDFIYKPFNAIFSRILGNDNLFKGLSTFAVEMSELRTILNLCDKNSIVLGDELCSGTEQESALSINTAGILTLNKRESSYLFATHFHDIVDFKEIKETNKLLIKHMSVIYDKETGDLIYERKFKDGSGSRSYGLEVLKSQRMPTEFIKECYDIKSKYFNQTTVLELNISKYNSEFIKEKICELCKINKAVDIHHINEQHKADDNKYIGSFHKDHKGNLVSLCKDCHRMQEDGNKKKIKKKIKTTSGIKLELESS